MSKKVATKTTTKKKKSSPLLMVKRVLKRDGSLVDFDIKRVETAIWKAMQASEEGSKEEADLIAQKVYAELLRITKRFKTFVPSVEGIQDSVEKELILSDYVKTAKSYILYREERNRTRDNQIQISDETRAIIDESSKYFKGPYQEFIFYRTYARWRDELGRRETWIESIDRYMEYMKENLGEKLSTKDYSLVREALLNQDICPSMRLLWSAGKACRKTNVCAYNCAYIAPKSWQDLSEIMYVSMCGCGMGFAAEPENVEKFPQIKKQTGKVSKKIVVEDSKEGWCNAFVEACDAWANGMDADIDYSKIRPAGARLATMGGRASGPNPLKDLMQFTRRKILARQGRRLTTLDVHDIACQIGLIVVAGGVRRSALISLSALDDKDMRDAKKGSFWQTEGQRSMANNSAVYEQKPTAEEFLEEWTALVKSKSGERGIFNRGGLEHQMPERRWEKMKDQEQPGVNPCGEIYLRSKQFCNLTSIVIRPKDDLKTLKRKMKAATILGTYQSSLTDFKYLSPEWKENCEEERLLGVSLTGYYDNEMVRSDKVLSDLRKEAIKVNKAYAKKMNVNPSTAITTVKPHGNSGQLLAVGSGMHPWFSKYFIRRVRISVNDPLLKFAQDQGIPAKPEVGYSTSSASTMVLEFPVAAPKNAVTVDQVTAIDLLHEWKRLKMNFVEHNPSATIYVGDDEWMDVAQFVYQNWEIVGGLSFLPRTDHVYELAPYEEITKEEYERLSKEIGEIDFTQLLKYEKQDNTTGAKELACVSGDCEI